MISRDEVADLALRGALWALLPRLLLLGLGFLAVLFLGQSSRFVAVTGIGAFGLLLLFKAFRTVVALGLGAVFLLSGTSATLPGTERKIWATKAILVFETLLYGTLVGVLYRQLFTSV